MDLDLLLGIGRFVLATTLILLLTVPTAFIIIQMEMKIIAQLALRFGPNRIGPRGIFQSTIHGFKVLAKEDTVPDQADRSTFTLAPWMVYMAAAMSMIVIPFAPGAIAADFSIGIVYFFAVLGLSVVGLLVAGWASYNKYSLLGGLRSAAQMVSYEIPLTLSVVGAIVLAGTLSFSEVIAWQLEHGWLLMYHGVHITAGGPIYRVGFALLDLEDPSHLLRRSDEWVFGPQAPYERAGDVDQVVFPCGWIADEANDALLLYYGAADTSVSLATASLSEVIAYVLDCPTPERRRTAEGRHRPTNAGGPPPTSDLG